jgi:hypothetical protein
LAFTPRRASPAPPAADRGAERGDSGRRRSLPLLPRPVRRKVNCRHGSARLFHVPVPQSLLAQLRSVKQDRRYFAGAQMLNLSRALLAKSVFLSKFFERGPQPFSVQVSVHLSGIAHSSQCGSSCCRSESSISATCKWLSETQMARRWGHTEKSAGGLRVCGLGTVFLDSFPARNRPS